MSKQVDWSKVLIHCSSLYSIMAGSDNKTKMQLWEDAVEEAANKQRQYDKLKKKDGPRAAQYEEAIEKWAIMLPILEAQRHEKEPLSKGCKTFLSGVYAFEKYEKCSVNKDIGSRETEKGKEVEVDSLQLVSFLDDKNLKKNEERVVDNWFSGHPDAYEGENILQATIIHDVKSPWDIETFLSYLGKKLPSIYYWQMQGYMALTGALAAEVHFCLITTPMRFIEDAARAVLRNKNVIDEHLPEYESMQDEVVRNMSFDDIPASERRIKVIVERNDTDIEKARRQVELCREYLANFEMMHLTGVWPGVEEIIDEIE